MRRRRLILSPTGCGGLTPLAEAICDAVVASPPGPMGSKILSISSDGGENNSSRPCAGYDSVIGPPPSGNYDPGSWQLRGWTAIQNNAVVSVRYWSAFGRPCGTRDRDVEIREVRAPAVDDRVFSEDLASSTGGTILFHDDGQPGIPTLPEWGLIGLGVLLLAGGVVVLGRRRLPRVATSE